MNDRSSPLKDKSLRLVQYKNRSQIFNVMGQSSQKDRIEPLQPTFVMPHSTRSQPSGNDTTMSETSVDPYVMELQAEARRLRGLIATFDEHSLTNGHLTNGYHSSESNAAEEMGMRSPAERAATGSSGQPSNHSRTTGAGAAISSP